MVKPFLSAPDTFPVHILGSDVLVLFSRSRVSHTWSFARKELGASVFLGSLTRIFHVRAERVILRWVQSTTLGSFVNRRGSLFLAGPFLLVSHPHFTQRRRETVALMEAAIKQEQREEVCPLFSASRPRYISNQAGN
jgi:hypothetical protein